MPIFGSSKNSSDHESHTQIDGKNGGKIETVTATYSTGNSAEDRARVERAADDLRNAKSQIQQAASEYSAAKSNQSSGAASATMVNANQDILASAETAKATARAASAAIGQQARNAAQSAYGAVVSGVAEEAGDVKLTLEESPRVVAVAQSESRRVQL